MSSRAPKAVRKNAEQADEMIRNMGNTEGGGTAEPAPGGEGDGNATPNASAADDAGQQSQADSGTPEKTPGSDQDQFQPLEQPLGEEEDSWQKRYGILQGKYNAEVPRLHQEIRDLKAQLANAAPADNGELDSLRNEVANLKQQLEQKGSEAPGPGNAPNLDNLKESYGEELINGLLSVVRQEIQPVAAEAQSAREQTQRNTRESQIATLRARLRENHGLDFDQINNDPLFVNEFLAERDPMSGVPRGHLLQQALEENDLDRVARIFTAYAAAPSASGNSNQQNLDQQVRVDRGASGADEPAPQQNLWNEESIAQFYHDKQRGKYTPEEADALEKEIFAFLGQANA